MLYLSGCKNNTISDDLVNGTIGLLQTPANGYALHDVAVWAMDNGCFTGAYPGDEEYLGLLNRLAEHKPRCLFVAIPDVVGDGSATLAQFQPMGERVREMGWPVALVAQDGMTVATVPWGQFDWLFMGGSTNWKLGMESAKLITEAITRGIGVHVGRVNSWRRFAHFAGLGCTTADGTFIAYGPDLNAPHVRRWVTADIQALMF